VGPLGVSLKEQQQTPIHSFLHQIFSVRTLFLLIVVVQNLLIAGIGWGIMYSYGYKSLESNTELLTIKIAGETYEKIKYYMAIPPLLMTTTAKHFSPDNGTIDIRPIGVSDVKTAIWKQLWPPFSTSSTNGLFLSTIYQDTIGYRPSASGRVEFLYIWRYRSAQLQHHFLITYWNIVFSQEYEQKWHT
jgi:hypothetical protein